MKAEIKPGAVELNRDQQIHFRVTADEKKAIESKSQAAGFNKVSDYLLICG